MLSGAKKVLRDITELGLNYLRIHFKGVSWTPRSSKLSVESNFWCYVAPFEIATHARAHSTVYNLTR